MQEKEFGVPAAPVLEGEARPAHTPLPWHHVRRPGTGAFQLRDNFGRMLAVLPSCTDHNTPTEQRANAAYIVRCVNSHHALVEALKAAQGYMLNALVDRQTSAPKKTTVQTLHEGVRAIEAALKATEN